MHESRGNKFDAIYFCSASVDCELCVESMILVDTGIADMAKYLYYMIPDNYLTPLHATSRHAS